MPHASSMLSNSSSFSSTTTTSSFNSLFSDSSDPDHSNLSSPARTMRRPHAENVPPQYATPHPKPKLVPFSAVFTTVSKPPERKVDPAVADLCRRFLLLVDEMRNLKEGHYFPSEDSREVFEVTVTGNQMDPLTGKATIEENDSDQRHVELVWRRDTFQDMDKIIKQTRSDIQNEVGKRLAQVKKLEAEITAIGHTIEDSQADSPELAAELQRLLLMKGQHRKRIRELQKLEEVEVPIGVVRSATRFVIPKKNSESQSSTASRSISVRDAWKDGI
eukprot:g9522.t1